MQKISIYDLVPLTNISYFYDKKIYNTISQVRNYCNFIDWQESRMIVSRLFWNLLAYTPLVNEY